MPTNYDFRLACENGDLDLAKELYELGFFDQTVFRGACEFGHIEVAIFLIDKNLNRSRKRRICI